MYAAITVLKFRPAKAGDAADLFGSLIMPAYALGAARGAWVFTNPEEYRALTIVLYDTREAAEAADEKDAVAEVIKARGDLLAEPPHRAVYHVAMGSMPSAPGSSSGSSASPASTAAHESQEALPALSGDILSLLAEVSRAL